MIWCLSAGFPQKLQLESKMDKKANSRSFTSMFCLRNSNLFMVNRHGEPTIAKAWQWTYQRSLVEFPGTCLSVGFPQLLQVESKTHNKTKTEHFTSMFCLKNSNLLKVHKYAEPTIAKARQWTYHRSLVAIQETSFLTCTLLTILASTLKKCWN